MDLEEQFVKEEGVDPFVICGNFIRDHSTSYILNKEHKDNVDCALQIAFETIKKLEETDDPVEVDYGQIEKVINLLSTLTIQKEREEPLIKFAKAFIFIAHNVNEHTIKNDKVRSKIAYIQRYCDNALTFSESLNMLRSMSGRLSRCDDWKPPSFRLSQHYYDIIKEE